MVKYTIMKRVTQLFASILFIITVLTIYLAFDFAINTAVANKHSTDKHDHHGHGHDNIIFKKTSSDLLLSKINKFNQTLKQDDHNHIPNQERRTRSIAPKQHQHGKPAQFHKSKTGIKVNQIKRSLKEQRKHLLATKTTLYKDTKSNNDKIHL